MFWRSCRNPEIHSLQNQSSEYVHVCLTRQAHRIEQRETMEKAVQTSEDCSMLVSETNCDGEDDDESCERKG